MSKKLYGALLPILAVAAFGMAPAVAQAQPHWYICEKKATAVHEYVDSACSIKEAGKGFYERVRLPFNEGTVKVRVKTFGVLTLTNATAGKIKCFVDDHGKIWNFSAATNGRDEVQVFENYECESVGATCKAGLAVTSEGLPWPTELVTGPPIRLKIGTAAVPIKIRVKCTEPALNVVFEGELTPLWVNGTQANGGVSFVEFGEGSGSLTSTIGAGTVTGVDYVIGVEHAENILVINP
jgi:hypothetical protein